VVVEVVDEDASLPAALPFHAFVVSTVVTIRLATRPEIQVH